MASSSPTNRRTLVLSTIAGVVAGGVWGATIQALATPSTPSFSIIGKRDMQIVLLDTTKIRVLILLGIPDDDLQIQIPALMTMLHQRIDILVGASDSLDALGVRFRKRWRVRHSLVFPTGIAVPNTSDQTLISENLDAELGEGISLGLTTTTRNAWYAAEASRNLWLITIRTEGNAIQLAPDSMSASVLGTSGGTVFVVPKAEVEQLSASLNPASIATNSRDDLPSPGDGGTNRSSRMLVRIYPQDIARFELRDTGVTLPAWAEGHEE